MSDLVEVPCNLCGKNDYVVMYKAALKKGEGGESVEKFSAASTHVTEDQVVKCKNCGLIYINPRLKPGKIISGYSEAVDEVYVSQSEGRMQSFRHVVDKITKEFGRKGKFLDVGCAAGFLLAAAKEKGWDVHGVEPSKWLGSYGSKRFGIDIDAGTLEEQKYAAKSFDVVCMFDVLEHVPDPAATLLECKRILKDDGMLVVNYPNIGSLWARAAGKKWWFLLSVHLTYFTPKTIKKMLEKTGFAETSASRYYGKLSIGYLVGRFKPYSEGFYKALNKITSSLKLNEKQVSYYASQHLVLAKKA